MTSGERFDLVVWGKGVRLEGFRPSEVDELFEWFAGGIDLVDDQRVPSLVVRMVRSPASAPTGLRSTIRHRGGISEKKYFLDGSHFEQTSQIRDVDIVFESPGLCCYGVDGTLLARNFPQPVNVGCGTIRELAMDLPTFELGDRCKIRLMPREVLARWGPAFERWHPVERILTTSWEALQENVYWDGDPDHPFWNAALRPRVLTERA